jgi:hypothetical protein
MARRQSWCRVANTPRHSTTVPCSSKPWDVPTTFVEGGRRLARDGELPVNTDGGQLSGGRLHGYGFLHEACVQLRGEAGERQVTDRPEVAVVGVGASNSGTTALLLTSN